MKNAPEGPVSRAVERLPLWDAPEIRSDPPVAPGSETSRLAALSLTDPMRRRSFRLIFAALSKTCMLTREQLSEATGLKESSLCARLSELSPVWVNVQEGKLTARSGCRVNGYELTEAGWRRWNQANSPAPLEGAA